jgi:hypothetical protein
MAAFAFAAVALAVGGITTSASAATITPARAGGQVVHTQLTLDCANMSKQVHRYAVAHHYCTATGAGVVSPDSTGEESGDCGSSYITINNQGGGYAGFSWGFASSLGPVVYRGLEVNWVNELFGNSGGWPDGSAMLGSNYSSPVRRVGTGQGNVFGDVGGYVVLLWGGTCDLLNPSTTQKIT